MDSGEIPAPLRVERLFARSSRLVSLASRNTVAYSLRKQMGSLRKATRRYEVERLADQTGRVSSQSQLKAAFAEHWKVRQGLRDDCKVKVERCRSMVLIRCEQVMTRDQMRQCSQLLAQIIQLQSEHGQRVAALETEYDSQRNGLFSSAVEREVWWTTLA